MQQSISIISRLPSVWPNWMTVSRSVSCAATTKLSSSSAGQQPAKPKPFTAVPGPKNYPLIGNMPYFRKFLKSGNIQLRWNEIIDEFGQIVKIKFPGAPHMLLLSHPDYIRQMFKATEDEPQRPAFLALKKIRDEDPENSFNKKGGILVEQGDEWRRVRSKAQVPLMKPKMVAMYIHQMDEVAQVFLRSLQESAALDDLSPKNLTEELKKWALESIALVALNKEMGSFKIEQPEETKRFVEASQQFIKAVSDVEMGGSMWKLYKTKAFKQLETAQKSVYRISRQAVEKAEKDLLEARRTSSDCGSKNMTILEAFLDTEGLSRNDTTTLVIDLIVAGVDNVATTMIYTLYALAKNTNCQHKLQQEIDSVLAGSEELLPEHIHRMKYLYSVFKEAMRLNTISAGNVRLTLRDAVIGGFHVPAGTILFALNRTVGLDEKFMKQANEFIPERWNRDKPLGEIDPYASLPFSLGVRMCIGKRIAMQEMSVLLIRILQNYTVTLDPDAEMKLYSDIVIRPASELPFKFTRRKFQRNFS